MDKKNKIQYIKHIKYQNKIKHNINNAILEWTRKI